MRMSLSNVCAGLKARKSRRLWLGVTGFGDTVTRAVGDTVAVSGMRAQLFAQAVFARGSSALRLRGAGWLITTRGNELIVVDERLVERARFPLPSAWRATHWVTPDIQFAAISERDRVLMIDREGRVLWEASHHPWGNADSESGSCWVDPAGRRVWATVPPHH